MEEGNNTVYLVAGYDVYMLGNPNGIRSADFIATKKNMVYYLEGKTMNSQRSLDELLSKASSQSERVVIDIIGTDAAGDVRILKRICKMNGWGAKNKRQAIPSPNKHTSRSGMFSST